MEFNIAPGQYCNIALELQANTKFYGPGLRRPRGGHDDRQGGHVDHDHRPLLRNLSHIEDPD